MKMKEKKVSSSLRKALLEERIASGELRECVIDGKRTGYWASRGCEIYNSRGRLLAQSQTRAGTRYVAMDFEGRNLSVTVNRAVYEAWYGEIADWVLVSRKKGVDGLDGLYLRPKRQRDMRTVGLMLVSQRGDAGTLRRMARVLGGR